MRLKLFALASKLANFLRTLALPDAIAQWSARGSCATVVTLSFQLAKVAVPRALFAAILKRIERLRGPPLPAA